MKQLIEDVKTLSLMELERADSKFGPFNSAHEGYAVIKEEIEETKEEFVRVENRLDHLWDSIKENEVNFNNAISIENYAIRLAAEAIQVAAMARKFRMLEGKENENNTVNTRV